MVDSGFGWFRRRLVVGDFDHDAEVRMIRSLLVFVREGFDLDGLAVNLDRSGEIFLSGFLACALP